MNSVILNSSKLFGRSSSLLRSRMLSNVSYQYVQMPSLSPTMIAGTIGAWKAAPGNLLRPGDVLCEIETDKASVAFEMQDESVLAKILVGAQTQEVKVGDAIAITVEDQDAYSAFLKLDPSVYIKGKSSTPAPSSPAPAPAASPAPTTPAAVTKAVDHNLRISPAARHILRSHNLDAEKIKGTGKKGMILKEDVTAAIRGVSPAPSQLPPASRSEVPAQAQVSTSSSSSSSAISTPVNDRFKDIPNNNMRKVIAKRLTESKANVPHFYTSIECNVDSVLSLRKKLKKDYDLNISVNDFVIKAAALALRDVPEANARWSTALGKVIESNGVDISVAVATPNGLITPILTSADKRSLVDINKTVKDLATRARDGKLKPEEFQGGSFSISNLGMYGVSSFSAVINPPQACILAVGAGQSRVVPGVDRPRVVNTVTVQLSADRRVVDEALAAQLLQAFKLYLSDVNAVSL